MVTRLDKQLKREINVRDKAYIVTITPQGLKVTLKGHRKGRELAWGDLIGDDATLAIALNASLEQPGQPPHREDDPDNQ